MAKRYSAFCCAELFDSKFQSLSGDDGTGRASQLVRKPSESFNTAGCCGTGWSLNQMDQICEGDSLTTVALLKTWS
jgi:hypothetical protein